MKRTLSIVLVLSLMLSAFVLALFEIGRAHV